jgi:hypothetical protein
VSAIGRAHPTNHVVAVPAADVTVHRKPFTVCIKHSPPPGETHARKGSFDVTITPQQTADDAPVARMTLYKEFHGDLEAVANGEMLAAHEPLTGAGVYVAIDRVAGTLHGKGGSFLMAHRGIRNAEGQSLDT